MSNIEDIEKRAAERLKSQPAVMEYANLYGTHWLAAEADLDLAIAGWKAERTTAFLATEAARKDALANHDLRRELAQARADLDQLRRDEGRRVVAEAERVRELREARADVRKLRESAKSIVTDAHLAGLVGLTMMQEALSDTAAYEEASKEWISTASPGPMRDEAPRRPPQPQEGAQEPS